MFTDLDSEYPVLIIGAGPVGLALAGDLGERGVPCLIVEQSDGAITQPRMDLVNVRTMEFCRRWGIVSAVEDCPYPRDYPQDVIYLKTLVGPELGRDPMPSMREARPLHQSPQKRERCPQNLFDPILKEFALSHETVAIRYKTKATDFSQDSDGVSVLVETECGQKKTLRAKYMVACDGGNSQVRQRIGIGMRGRGVLTYTTNIVFRSADFHHIGRKKPGYRYVFIDNSGVWATIVAINGREDWRFSIVGSSEKRL